MPKAAPSSRIELAEPNGPSISKTDVKKKYKVRFPAVYS